MTYRAWPTQVQDLYFTKGILNTYTVNVTEIEVQFYMNEPYIGLQLM